MIVLILIKGCVLLWIVLKLVPSKLWSSRTAPNSRTAQLRVIILTSDERKGVINQRKIYVSFDCMLRLTIRNKQTQKRSRNAGSFMRNLPIAVGFSSQRASDAEAYKTPQIFNIFIFNVSWMVITISEIWINHAEIYGDISNWFHLDSADILKGFSH